MVRATRGGTTPGEAALFIMQPMIENVLTSMAVLEPLYHEIKRAQDHVGEGSPPHVSSIYVLALAWQYNDVDLFHAKIISSTLEIELNRDMNLEPPKTKKRKTDGDGAGDDPPPDGGGMVAMDMEAPATMEAKVVMTSTSCVNWK